MRRAGCSYTMGTFAWWTRTGKNWKNSIPDYLDYIGEHVEEWSYLKFPFYLKMGWPKGIYRVGPLGRLNVADKINTPLAKEEFNNFKSIGGGKPVEGTLWYHYARLIEDLYAIERAKEILLDPDVLPTDLATDYHDLDRRRRWLPRGPPGNSLSSL